MRTITTDQGSGFASEVMRELLTLLGVKVHNFTAAGDSQGMGATESSNNAASEVITEMGNLGTIKTKQDLCLALAQKCVQRNQIVQRHGVTAFEVAHGRRARTVCDVLTQVPDVELREVQGQGVCAACDEPDGKHH
jgi:hypothetical protein